METVEKVLDVLEIFLIKEGEVGIAEIANLSGVNISTAYRIASDLVKRGYLRQKNKGGKYTLGVKLLEFQSRLQKSTKIGDLAQSYLQKLSRDSGEYCEVAILDNNTAVTIAQIETDHSLRVKNLIGERLPLYKTSVGKVILAYMEEEERQNYYADGKVKFKTDHLIFNLEALETELTKIKKLGYSVDDKEFDQEIWSVAAPIMNSQEQLVASLAIAAPAYRTDSARANKLTRLVIDYADAISLEMDFKGLAKTTPIKKR